MRNRNWRGLILDGRPDLDEIVRHDPGKIMWAHQLTAKSAFITRGNINELLSEFQGEIGLLSVDIDGNDYWVWEAISVVNPIIVVVEYNAVFGDVYPVSIPYIPSFQRTAAHFSNLYFGCSIAALRSLATRKGYRFVGTNSAGSNAFFVRDDFAGRIESSLRRIEAFPSLARESINENRQLNYISGTDRFRHISAMTVINVETGQRVTLGELSEPYSRQWLAYHR